MGDARNDPRHRALHDFLRDSVPAWRGSDRDDEGLSPLAGLPAAHLRVRDHSLSLDGRRPDL